MPDLPLVLPPLPGVIDERTDLRQQEPRFDFGVDPGVLPSVTAPPGKYEDATQTALRHAQDVGLAGMGSAILGGLLTGMARIQAGQTNAETDRHNAALADLAAGDAIVRGHFAAAVARMRGAQVTAKQSTAYASAGVDVRSASALDVLNSSAAMTDLDAMTIASNAAREAWGYRTQGQSFRRRADIEQATANNQAGESILGGVTRAGLYGAKMFELV